MNPRMCACLAGALIALASFSSHAQQTASPPASDPSGTTAPGTSSSTGAGTSTSTAASPPAVPDSFGPEFYAQPAWELVFSPYAYHWSNQDAHTNVYLIGIERDLGTGFLWGFSAFQNSFGQASAYAYYGYTWNNLFETAPRWYFKLTGGVIYGYKYPHENDVPFNHDGFGLGIIPGVGYRLTPRDALQVDILGSSALIFTYNHRF